MPPQVNARLTRIDPQNAEDGVDDWDIVVPPPDPAVAKWVGGLDAYYRETVRRQAGQAADDVLLERTAWVDTADLPAELDTTDVLTLELDDGRTVTSPAKTIARSQLAGIPTTIATTRLDLEDG